jgi:hypothetical protein
MKTSGTVLTSFIALSIVAVGCGSTPDPVPERVVTTTTVYEDNPSSSYRRRPNERLYEARVSEVRAIVGPTEQRCWIERESAPSRGASVGGAIAGAVVGGILGHQIGSGRGNDVATAGGAIAGGAIGSQAGKRYSSRDVKRCETVASDTAEFYDVTYVFNGVEHHVQMTDHPGRTVTVNSEGEPRA